MPEIAEVARIVHHLKKSLVGKTLSVVKAQDDANVFGKVGTSATEFQTSLTGKKVLDAGQQGKYFWMIMSSPPHPVFHFGMTGWFHIRGEQTAYYRPKETDKEEVWPPKFWKFALETDSEPKVEAAFTDARRFARIRLVDCAAEDIRNTSPLKENGPDPVIDKDILTEEWLLEKMKKRHVPVKAFMLDQANISGIGNWVGDEIMYHAKLHPEQYTDTFSADQIKQLHTSMLYVCQTAVDHLADSSKFPEEWLFKHRWGKGKKDAATTLPNGAKLTFLTVGGRTSCVVPSIQKKTGPVAADVDGKMGGGAGNSADAGEGSISNKAKGPSKKRKIVLKEEEDEEDLNEGDITPVKKKRTSTSKKDLKTAEPIPQKPRRSKKLNVEKGTTKSPPASKKGGTKAKVENEPVSGRRRSGRVTNGKI
ncbi:hypothetical protein ONS95_011449 [Cadophora gregata]|uniref:uncharacterized protein n=1 Tax=Cadophora gregata TaxID=51156 RepID=UPI0026DBDD34|nr:uncharacterized protein ONS95_011449 [Cadophora gregata]KAK0120035.1 hypothetical protein ONS95_011449 [Cadophora gregata]KAK0121068.1 hypothetical protein ONS96_011251 [Cadophora gregata f. sp. sojae]